MLFYYHLGNWVPCSIIHIPLKQRSALTLLTDTCVVTASYYGKTCHHFFTRAAEHMGISNLTGKRLKGVEQSAISDNLLECNCSIDWSFWYSSLSGKQIQTSYYGKFIDETWQVPLKHYQIISVKTIWLKNF